MTLTDAINSGKRFKRKEWAVWVTLKENTKGTILLDDKEPIAIKYAEDLIADDWEIEEETISLSWRQIAQALRKSSRTHMPRKVFVNTRKALGYKESEEK